jgi:hypothetical protein
MPVDGQPFVDAPTIVPAAASSSFSVSFTKQELA